jgi:4-hydroxybenzoate polyprenyltransferase
VRGAETRLKAAPRRFRWDEGLAAIETLRPSDTALVIIGTLICARLAGPIELTFRDVLIVALVNGLLCGASMAFNDWHDVHEDGVNKPRRPIVAGRIERTRVLRLSASLFLAAVLLATLVPGWRFGIFAAATVVASVAYTTRLKSIPLAGNLTVAVVQASPIWCFMLWELDASSLYYPLCVAAIADRLGTEVIKTSEDWRGDLQSKLDTVATRFGPRPALALGSAALCVASLATWWPVASGQASGGYVIWASGLSVLAIAIGLQQCRALPADVIAADAVRLHRVTLVLAVVGLMLV